MILPNFYSLTISVAAMDQKLFLILVSEILGSCGFPGSVQNYVKPSTINIVNVSKTELIYSRKSGSCFCQALLLSSGLAKKSYCPCLTD